jgi:hypothetical protein
MKTALLMLSADCLAVLATGCVERRVVYVPAPQPQSAPAYAYQPPVEPPSRSPTNALMVAQAPPVPQVEAVPVAPGPDYFWMPGYWSVGVGGGWVWVGGHYVVRPRPYAVWVAGHWARRGHGYMWIGGYWR